MSAVSPALAAAGPKTASYDMTLKMSKPLNFRIDMVMPVATSNVTVTGWSTGNGYLIQANNRRNRLTSDEDLFDRFTSGSSIGITVGIGEIVRLFAEGAKQDLDDPNIQWQEASKDVTLNGQHCYLLAGMLKLQPVMVWVDRRTFLIPQTQVVMNAAVGAGGRPGRRPNQGRIEGGEQWKRPNAPANCQRQETAENHRLSH